METHRMSGWPTRHGFNLGEVQYLNILQTFPNSRVGAYIRGDFAKRLLYVGLHVSILNATYR